jgi:hypothetical protein
MKRYLFSIGSAAAVGLAMVTAAPATAQTLVDPNTATIVEEQSGQNVAAGDARPAQRRSILRRDNRLTPSAAAAPAATTEAPAYQPPARAAAAPPVAPQRSAQSQFNQPAVQPQSYLEPATYNQLYGRPYLGVSFDQRYPNATVVRSVNAGSPAEQAGLRPGDTIHAINNSLVSNYQSVIDLVGTLRPGDRLEVAFSRRIDDRAQIVLAGRQIDQPQTASYGAPPAAPPAPAAPPQASTAQPQEQSTPDYATAPVQDPNVEGASASQTDERGGVFNRNRSETRERARGLLRRRN